MTAPFVTKDVGIRVDVRCVHTFQNVNARLVTRSLFATSVASASPSARSTQACLVSAPRERAPPQSRTGRIGLRCLDFGRDERLRGNGVCVALGKNLFDLGVRAGNDVY